MTVVFLSRPAWGAWIETTVASMASEIEGRSRPAWGAWIETYVLLKHDDGGLSRPAWGALIETYKVP